jgi:hypothetical protein
MKRKRATRADIQSFCGVFKRKPGEKSVVQELLEDRAAEKRREEEKWERCFGKPPADK